MSVSSCTDQMSDVQLADFAKLIRKVTGIRVSPQKKMLLSNRIRRRLRVTGIPSFEAYCNRLRELEVCDPEWDAFLEEITTHETYLFRDEAHWKWFRESYLKEITTAASRGKRKKELRIWSAACSTGDEAYTIASCIAACLPNCSQWKIDIVGTDIGIATVEKAQQAQFGERAMKLVPENYRRRFFKQHNKDGLWSAKPELTRWTSFRQHNLLDRFSVPPFDLVFLKNVMIYFDSEAKRTAVKHLCNAMRPGGMLITSAAENVSGFLTNFERVSAGMHRKPKSPGKKGAHDE